MKIKCTKIASVTKNAHLPSEVSVTSDFKPESGLLLVVEVLEDKKIYNQLELVSGRLSTLKKGDILAVALGNRKALKGFVGKIPEQLAVGHTIHILNIGGVAGICTSENLKEVGHALSVKVLGAITEGKKVLTIKAFKTFEPHSTLASKIPLIVVSGTCMNVGKTTVACETIKALSQKGFTVAAAKLTGIAALRDTENMKDYGASWSVSFLDAGFTSTVQNESEGVAITKGAIDHLSQYKPDVIVIEFGDGVFGEYGVMEILKDPEIQKNMGAHLGCAHDPMGATKLAEVCEQIGAPLTLISGPVTDNEVGVNFIKKFLNLPALNALTQPQDLFNHLSLPCLKQ
ncbi:MAG: hypothetical protein ACD_28C00284G0002 [uncultured bacterium]|nr:MAG: hypothetical protein ACD_28C00284G0002 [uncultured bacterium]KKT72937.1 MAG: hypothetical protein UW70_C0095G0004 [Candidatus Peregrinibacteria bacterium GW2011_GWA2_44_7]